MNFWKHFSHCFLVLNQFCLFTFFFLPKAFLFLAPSPFETNRLFHWMSRLPVFNTVCFFLGFRCIHGNCIVKGPMSSKANWFLFYFPTSGTKDGGSYDLHRYSHLFILNSIFPIIAWSVISTSFCFLPSCTEHKLWCMCVLTPSSFPGSRPFILLLNQFSCPPRDALWAFALRCACHACLLVEWCFETRNAATGEWMVASGRAGRLISCVWFSQLGREAAWNWEIFFFHLRIQLIIKKKRTKGNFEKTLKLKSKTKRTQMALQGGGEWREGARGEGQGIQGQEACSQHTREQ